MKDGRPFFAYVGPHAPHYPAYPAPWYETAFSDVTIPVTPNYNLSSPDKAQHVRQNAGLTEEAKCWEDQHFRDRWRSLLSVDDLVEALTDKLQAEVPQHCLDPVLFCFCQVQGWVRVRVSDSGLALGQSCLVWMGSYSPP